MSRWQDNFESQKSIWNQILEVTEKLSVNDSTVTADVEELARAKKVIEHISALLEACDPEFIPLNVWDEFNNKISACISAFENFADSNDVANLKKANSHLDNLLTYIQPYSVTTENSAIITNLLEIQTRFQKFEKTLFEGEKSLEAQINKLHSSIKNSHDKVEEYHDTLLADEDGDYDDDDSIETEIKKAKEAILQHKSSMDDKLSDAEKTISDLKEFSIDIFGSENEETEEREGGLQQELDSRFKQLDEFSADQEKRCDALYEKIEGHLPGATSAGLASAYENLKVKAEGETDKYTKVFYWSLGGMLLIIITLTSFEFFGWDVLKITSFTGTFAWLNQLLLKLAITSPVLWLILFASKRRSEFHRLEQEYAHKEALATSYHSFELQINKLKGNSEESENDNKELMERLLKTMIDAIGRNASVVLDGKHGDKSPVQEIGEGVVQTVKPKANG